MGNQQLMNTNLGTGSIPTAFQFNIARCKNCQLEKNMPQKIESRTKPDLSPLQRAVHPSKDTMSDDILTLLTAGGLPDPVIIHGYSFKASNIFACLVLKVDKRPTEFVIAVMSMEYLGSNLETKGGTALLSAMDGEFSVREAEATWARSLISSNGELTRHSIMPAANPAIRASETCTLSSSRPSDEEVCE